VALSRRRSRLSSAGWVPPRLWFVAELPPPRHGRIDRADVHNAPEDSPPDRDAADLADLSVVSLCWRRHLHKITVEIEPGDVRGRFRHAPSVGAG
jgi:hypothetical protein